MKLDRNLNPSGKGKYAIVNLRKVEGDPHTAMELAAAIVVEPRSVEFGYVGDPDEFWLIKLKDKYAGAALRKWLTRWTHQAHQGATRVGSIRASLTR